MAANGKQDNKTQYERFKEMARKLESDEDEGRFDERLKRIAKQKPKPKEKPRTKNK